MNSYERFFCQIEKCCLCGKKNPLFISAGCESPKYTQEGNVRAISAALCDR